MADFEPEDWFPMSPDQGPPLPRFLSIKWPWYKEEEAPPPGVYPCPYCDQSFELLEDLIDHVKREHPDKPPLEYIEIEWE